MQPSDLALVKSLIREKKFTEVLNLFISSKKGRFDSTDYEVKFSRAQCYMGLQQYDTAISLLLTMEPNVNVKVTLARCHEALKNNALAEHIYDELRERYPENRTVLLNFGRFLQNMGEIENSEYMKKSIQTYKRFPGWKKDRVFLRSIGYILQRQIGSTVEAITIYDLMLELNPDDVEASVDKARCLFNIGRANAALEILSNYQTPAAKLIRLKCYLLLNQPAGIVNAWESMSAKEQNANPGYKKRVEQVLSESIKSTDLQLPRKTLEKKVEATSTIQGPKKTLEEMFKQQRLQQAKTHSHLEMKQPRKLPAIPQLCSYPQTDAPKYTVAAETKTPIGNSMSKIKAVTTIQRPLPKTPTVNNAESKNAALIRKASSAKNKQQQGSSDKASTQPSFFKPQIAKEQRKTILNPLVASFQSANQQPEVYNPEAEPSMPAEMYPSLPYDMPVMHTPLPIAYCDMPDLVFDPCTNTFYKPVPQYLPLYPMPVAPVFMFSNQYQSEEYQDVEPDLENSYQY